MKFTSKMAFNIVLGGLIGFSSASWAAEPAQFERAQKEIKIMNTIFQTALSQSLESEKRFGNMRSSKAIYLAKQGMVFNFNFSRHGFNGVSNWSDFGEGLGMFVSEIASEVGSALAEVPVAPMSPVAGIDTEDQMEAYEERLEQLEAMREKQREQREKVRELQQQIRELERQKDRAADKNSRLDEVKSELKEKLTVLENKMDEYKKSMDEYRKKRDQKYEANAKKKSATIFSTLCDYGATLKSLDDDEFITLVFENYEDNKDKIYVFEFEQVKSCRSADKMVSSAITYLL